MNTFYPEVEHGIVNRATNTLFKYQGWPTVARDENGTLYVASSSFRIYHVCPFGKTAMYISKNEGKTWTPPIVINDTYLDDRDGGLLYAGDGRLVLTWFTLPGRDLRTEYLPYITRMVSPMESAANLGMVEAVEMLPDEELEGGSWLRVSEDYGVTWSTPVRMPISAPHGPNVCRDGSLVYLGLEYLSRDELPSRCIATYKSFDGGYTWERVSILPRPSWLKGKEFLDEPHIMELPDGRLLGSFRVENREPTFSVAIAVSEDGGRTWSEPVCTDVSGSPPHLMMHSSGAIICSYGRRQAPYGERAMVSYDLGVTWEDEYVLDESPSGDLGYPSTVELSDGSLMTVYYQKYKDDKKCSILYTKWRLRDR